MADRRVAVEIDADVGPFSRGLAKAATEAKAFSRELESADGRMANLVQAGLALAPALVPIGAAAVPAVAGLANQLGFATIAAGSALLAFNGIGDALKALNTYQLEPTSANLAKMRTAMDGLGPAGRDFVRQLQSLRPELQQLQAAAEAGLLPGVGDSIDELLTRMPEVERLVSTVTSTLGGLAKEAGKSLAGPEWDSFFEMLQRQARPTLTAMGHALGDVVSGLADLWVAFEPLETDFNRGLQDAAKSFHQWAEGLSQTQGFRDFIDYVRENGPRVADALEAVGNAFVQLIRAAAPIGAISLQGLTVIANAIAALAQTPLGPTVIGLAVLVGVLGRLQAVGRSLGSGALKSPIARMGADAKAASVGMRSMAAAEAELTAAQAALSTSAVKARDAQFALIPTDQKRAALSEYTAAQERVAVASKGVAAAQEEQAAGFRRTAGLAARGAAGIGLMVVATSGLTDKLGASHAAMGAMLGMMAGPEGAAIGALAGGVWDVVDAFKNAGSSAEYMAREAKAELSPAYVEARARLDAMNAANDAAARGLDLTAAGAKTAAASIQSFTAQVDIMNQRLSNRASMRDFQQGLDDFTASLAKNGRTLDINTQAGRDNQAALDNIASTALKVAENMKGLNRVKFLQAARADFVDAAEKAGMTRDAANRLANRLISLNQIHAKPSVDLQGASKAQGQLDSIMRTMNVLNGKHVDTFVTTHHSTTLGDLLNPGVPKPKKGTGADGRTVPKDGAPYGDRYPYLLAPGEEVISNRFGQADRHRGLLKAINAGRLADGGTAMGGFGAQFASFTGFSAASHALDGFINATNKASTTQRTTTTSLAATLKAATKDLDSTRTALQNLRQAASSLRGSVVQAFDPTSAFGVQGSWTDANGNDIFSQLSLSGQQSLLAQQSLAAAQSAGLQAQAFAADISKLSGRGFGGAALQGLASSGNLALADALAAMSKSDSLQWARSFNQATRQTNQSARAVSTDVYGKEISRKLDQLHDLKAEVKSLRAEVKASHSDKSHQDLANRNGAAVGKAVRSGLGASAVQRSTTRAATNPRGRG